MSSRKTRLQLIVGLLLSAAPWLLAMNQVASFLWLYHAWGLGIPVATRLLIDYPDGLLVLPLMVVVVWGCLPNNDRRGIASLSAGFLIGALGYLLVELALYWPVIWR